MAGTLEKSDLILLLLYGKGAKGQFGEPVQGITRLMKLLFLLDKEAGIDDGFSFVPYKMGPFSSEVYPELEFLRNFPFPENPLVKGTENGMTQDAEVSPEQVQYVDDIQFDEAPPDNSEVDVAFQLTDIGKKVAKELWDGLDEKGRAGIETIKGKYGNWPLRKLLKYVYENYPDMTTNSEIKDQILQ
jgi:hypothetical protein